MDKKCDLINKTKKNLLKYLNQNFNANKENIENDALPFKIVPCIERYYYKDIILENTFRLLIANDIILNISYG